MTEEMVKTFSERRDLICRLAREAGLRFEEPAGAFYLMADVRSYGMSAEEFAMGLLEKKGVVTVPLEDFGAPGHIRLSYTLPEGEIVRGMEKIGEYLHEVENG